MSFEIKFATFLATVLMALAGVRPASAAAITGASVETVLPPGLVWDTFGSGHNAAFVKQAGSFLNPTGQPVSIDVGTPGTYPFDLRLPGGPGLVVTKYNFNLFFDGAPEGSIPGIRVLAPINQLNQAPFGGKYTELIGTTLITLDSVGLFQPQVADEVGPTSAVPDGAPDYFGSFQLTVSQTPEPAGPAVVVMAALLVLMRRRLIPIAASCPVR
jgi:hypothetical protein